MNVLTTAVAATLASVVSLAAQTNVLTIEPGASRLSVPDFQAYEAEYTSASGRFFNEVRPVQMGGAPKISVLNLIHTPQGVIVDHSVIDRKTLRQENGFTPYFAWGQEFLVYRATDTTYDLVRVPLAGGEPIRSTGPLEHNGFFDGLGFSPTFAAFLPLTEGAQIRIPRMTPIKGGTITSTWVTMTVTGTESVKTPAGVSCQCTVLEERTPDGPTHRYWVSREAPFLFKRHRDVGGSRDTVSELLSFRQYD